MLEILDNSAAKSGLIAYKAPVRLPPGLHANFSDKWMHKDIGLMLESGKELGVPLLLTVSDPPAFPDGHRRRPWR